MKTTFGFCKLEVEGEPPVKVHSHDVGFPVDKSLNETESPKQGVFVLAVNAALIDLKLLIGVSHIPLPYVETRKAELLVPSSKMQMSLMVVRDGKF